MLKAKTELRLITLFLLILGVTGCSNELPVGLAHNLERASDIKFGFVALIDSSTGQTKYLRNANAGTSRFFDKPQPASEITEVTTVSVVGVSGIAGYQSCNYITINSPQVKSTDTRLICLNNENRKSELWDSDKASEIRNLSKDLFNRLTDTGNINNLGFLILTDIITGETKLFRHENYVDLPVSDSLSVTEVKNNNAWSVVTFRVNPCYSCTTNSQGGQDCVYLTYCPKK